MKTKENESIKAALNEALTALIKVDRLFEGPNAENIDLNDLDATLYHYPFDKSFDEIVRDFANYVGACEDDISKIELYRFIDDMREPSENMDTHDIIEYARQIEAGYYFGGEIDIDCIEQLLDTVPLTTNDSALESFLSANGYELTEIENGYIVKCYDESLNEYGRQWYYPNHAAIIRAFDCRCEFREFIYTNDMFEDITGEYREIMDNAELIYKTVKYLIGIDTYEY